MVTAVTDSFTFACLVTTADALGGATAVQADELASGAWGQTTSGGPCVQNVMNFIRSREDSRERSFCVRSPTVFSTVSWMQPLLITRGHHEFH